MNPTLGYLVYTRERGRKQKMFLPSRTFPKDFFKRRERGRKDESCVIYFSRFVDKTLDRKQLEGRVCLGSEFEGTVHHGRKV